MPSFSRQKPSATYKVNFNLYLSGHPTYLLSNDEEATNVFNKIKDIFKDSVNMISASNVKYIYSPIKNCINIEFNEFVKDAEIRNAIVTDIKYLIEKIICSNHVHEKYNLQKHVIKINNDSFYEYINSKVNNNLDKEYLITENFYLYTGDSVSITSFYYLS